MCRRALLAMLFAVLAAAGETPKVSSFYIVSEFFSDYGAQYYYRVLEVRPDGSGSLVRYFRVAVPAVFCRRRIVQYAEARVSQSPSQLTAPIQPCVVNPRRLASEIRKHKARFGVFESVSFGVVAQCGSSSVEFALPIAQKVNLKALSPDLAHLWDLDPRIVSSVFGSKDRFSGLSEDQDLALQKEGQKRLPELISGKYDSGLHLAAGSDRDFRSLLEGYHGPFTTAQAQRVLAPQLEAPHKYQFLQYVDPKYPPLAIQAQIQGLADLRLTVDRVTGQVMNAEGVSGHPLLVESVANVAKQWRFDPKSIASGTIEVTFDFEIRCP